MYQEITTVVSKIIYENDEIQILETSTGAGAAILYLSFSRHAQVGDQVVVNHTAQALNLGTGGYDIVKHVLGHDSFDKAGAGHIMKARYTPNQLSVMSVESQESPFHQLFAHDFTLNGKPILIAELHSMIPVIFQILKNKIDEFVFTVIIDDAAALPLALSKHMRILKENKQFHSITIGQAFGGEFEAVNLQTALQFAVNHLKSDYILVSMGPGVVGTGTRYGFSGMMQANWANTIGSLKGVPVWVPRISFADRRDRHNGLSHHTLTPLSQFTHVKSVLPLPTITSDDLSLLEKQIQPLLFEDKVEIHWIDPNDKWLNHVIDDYPIAIKTMGRSYKEDPFFFSGISSAVQYVLSI